MRGLYVVFFILLALAFIGGYQTGKLQASTHTITKTVFVETQVPMIMPVKQTKANQRAIVQLALQIPQSALKH